MTTTFKAKHRSFITQLFLIAVMPVSLLASCKKNDDIITNKNHPFKYSSEVADKWMTLQLRLMRNATGVPNHAFSRHFAYTGIALFESLAPGLTGTDKKWSSKWNGLTGLPVAANANNYYFPANANAALATINRSFFSAANAADKAAIDSLEAALNQEFLLTKTASEIGTSSQFGKDVATAVFNWAETDGYKNANASYTVPTGAGLWKPTPPAFAAPLTPYWGNNRNIIIGSTTNTQPAAPIVYSTEPSSSFYQMVKQVYDVSQVLTDDQKAMAIFWRDIPGVSSPGHWLSILQQVIQHSGAKLDKTALAYALTGIAINDALISCFQTKYQYNLVRPVTYIREVMGHSAWNTFIGTPAHPEYSSAHASLSAAAADILTELFGKPQTFIDHTYDYLSLPPRTYPSFTAIGEEAGMSRLYAGIHYLPSITLGLAQGRKVTANIFKQTH
jgi:PAP2 superfamily